MQKPCKNFKIILKNFQKFKDILIIINVKPDPHILQFLENSRECWATMGEQVMCRSVYSYILTICHHALNTFLAFLNLPNQQILVNTYVKNQFSPLLVNLCKNAREHRRIFGIHLSSAIHRELTYVWIQLKKKKYSKILQLI